MKMDNPARGLSISIMPAARRIFSLMAIYHCIFAKQAGERETLERRISGLTEEKPQETERIVQTERKPEQGRQREISLSR